MAWNKSDVKDEGTSHEAHWWKLVEYFVTRFNEYHTYLFYYLDVICADESILRWYIQGVHWINLGLPIYVEMDRNPNNGVSTQNNACGRSGIMMYISIFKYENNEAEQ